MVGSVQCNNENALGATESHDNCNFYVYIVLSIIDICCYFFLEECSYFYSLLVHWTINITKAALN